MSLKDHDDILVGASDIWLTEQIRSFLDIKQPVGGLPASG
jgi:hypothetical protein